jgi:hypothetical protein
MPGEHTLNYWAALTTLSAENAHLWLSYIEVSILWNACIKEMESELT